MKSLSVAMLCVVTLGLSSCYNEGGNVLAQARAVPSEGRIEGMFKVRYAINSTLTASHDRTLDDVTALSFYKQYVVAETKSGGRLFLLHSLRELSWERKCSD